MRILLFGGTSEGRALAEELAGFGARVTVCVATEYGRELLAQGDCLSVVTGRKNAREMAALLAGFDLCVDATHPYAIEASQNIRAACEISGVPCRRCLREEAADGGYIHAKSAAHAAELVGEMSGNILLATGAKELPCFANVEPARLFARILPTHEGLSACQALGLPGSHIIAMQGPFSQALNEALMDQLNIRVLVTKDGGAAGGFPEKAAAAERLGAALVVISRPKEAGLAPDEIVHEVKELMRCK